MLRQLMVAAVPAARDAPTDALIQDVVAHAPMRFHAALRAATWFLWWLGPLVASGLPAPFGLLPSRRRERVLERLASSRTYLLREMPTIVKMLACFAWGAMPAAQRRVGIATPDDALPLWARS
jgi:hypothetical protein